MALVPEQRAPRAGRPGAPAAAVMNAGAAAAAPLAAQRRERFMIELRRTGAVRVSAIARTFGVAELTVRRDIAALAAAGRVVRVHGGATLPELAGLAAAGSSSGVQADARTVGMVVPSLEYYWPDVVAGARAAAEERGVRIVLRGSSYDGGEDDRSQISRLLHGGVDGLLVAPTSDGPMGARLAHWLESLPVPTVLMERRPPAATGSHRLGWVVTDHALGADIAVRHLAAQGHRTIGVLVSHRSPTSLPVLRGWRDATRALRLPVDPKEHAASISAPDSVWPPLEEELLRLRGLGCTALLVQSDWGALAVLAACRSLGLAVPADLALVSYDDEVAASATPALTAVHPPRGDLGRRAVDLLLERLDQGAERAVQRVQLVPSLVVRDSSVQVDTPPTAARVPARAG
ncbi:substrate-binding domain-containing protein [Cellulomonas marina]|uniref:DNA-binding transcriptional regulator, LacI/PurR family n=1 Tax=Cellulomonas marina TaxID=988821 RepID=A0A1I1AWY8_9CELL|nr:substrate-binding domain-containing protein [Cellulomonas marina]GIG30797.1 LacI family transcriptional regulator [Cellulomonas marina]SFB42377.1 DNA-binding transcriptional regulator, LacI/PurR family [Cellulomonas marina]